MGTWDVGTWGNDDAADWLAELADGAAMSAAWSSSSADEHSRTSGSEEVSIAGPNATAMASLAWFRTSSVFGASMSNVRRAASTSGNTSGVSGDVNSP